MIRTTPSWMLKRPDGTSAWPGRVRLHGQIAVGQWYGLRRADGAVIWERLLPGVNHITGIHDGIALCAKVEPGWEPGTGASALRIADGEVLWSAALAPFSLEQTEFLGVDGTVRDLASARPIRKLPAPARLYYGRDGGVHLAFALTLTNSTAPPLELAPGILVAHKGPRGERRNNGDYCGATPDGDVLWWFSPVESGWHCAHARGDRFVAPPYIYLLASKTRPYRYIDVGTIEYVPTTRYLLIFDVRLGKIVQEVDLGSWTGSCRIDDVDDEGAVLSFESTNLAYYASISTKYGQNAG